MPILPMLIKALGGGSVVIGLVGGLRDGLANILKMVAGYWSDKTGKRKVFLFFGYSTSAFFKLLLSFSKSWPSALIFSTAERVGKGIRTAPLDATIAESMPKKKGEGFGIHKAFDTAGAIAGSLLAFLLFWVWNFNFRSIIILSAIIGFIALLPLNLVKETKSKPQKISLKGLNELPAPLKTFIMIAGIFALANFSYMFFILKAQTIFIGKSSIGMPIFLYILYNIFYTALAIPAGMLSDKIGRYKTMILGYLLFSLVSLGFVIFNNFIAFALLFAGYGLFCAIVNSGQRAYISDLSSEKLSTTAFGIFHSLTGLMTLVGSLIAGFLWGKINPNAAFIYGSILSLSSVVFLIVFKNKLKT